MHLYRVINIMQRRDEMDNIHKKMTRLESSLRKKGAIDFCFIIDSYKDYDKKTFISKFKTFEEDFADYEDVFVILDELYCEYGYQRFWFEMKILEDSLVEFKLSNERTSYNELAKITYLRDSSFFRKNFKKNPTNKAKFCYLYKLISKVFYEDSTDVDRVIALNVYTKYCNHYNLIILKVLEENLEPPEVYLKDEFLVKKIILSL